MKHDNVFYVFFGGLQGSWNIAEPFVGIEWYKNDSFVKVWEIWPSCYTILVAVKIALEHF